MPKKIIQTNQAPRPVGPYSQAVQHQGLLFVSGQIPIHPESGELVLNSIEDETRQVLDNLKAVVEAAGSSLENVLKVGIFVTDITQFDVINQIYADYFSEAKPARALVEVSQLPKGVHVEMDAVAYVE